MHILVTLYAPPFPLPPEEEEKVVNLFILAEWLFYWEF